MVNTVGSGTLGNSSYALTINGTVTASSGQTIAITGTSVTNNGPGGTSPPPSLQAIGGTLVSPTCKATRQHRGHQQRHGHPQRSLAEHQHHQRDLRHSQPGRHLHQYRPDNFRHGCISTSNGTVNILGTLTNTGQTLSLPNTNTAWNINGGTINGGTVRLPAAQLTATGNSTLNNNVTLTG